MKTRTAKVLLFVSVLVLPGCGVIGHNVSRLGGAIPDLSSLGGLLKIENQTEGSQAVRIEGGERQFTSHSGGTVGPAADQ